MVAIRIVLVFAKPESAPLASIEPVINRADNESIEVTHIGILFRI
jgi:hypothetical protein